MCRGSSDIASGYFVSVLEFITFERANTMNEHRCCVHCDPLNTDLMGIDMNSDVQTFGRANTMMDEHRCCVHCDPLNTDLTIGRPVHCQNCNNTSSLSLQLGQPSSSTSSPSTKSPSPEAPHVARSPERQHRALNVYNLFISEEIKRIKAANPQIKHEAAFKLAKKNWPTNGYEWMRQNGFL